jgi:hypothetical protein
LITPHPRGLRAPLPPCSPARSLGSPAPLQTALRVVAAKAKAAPKKTASSKRTVSKTEW